MSRTEYRVAEWPDQDVTLAKLLSKLGCIMPWNVPPPFSDMVLMVGPL